MKKLYWIDLKNIPIVRQLELEEAILRTDDRNFALVNQGSPKTIVMGLSGDPDQLLDMNQIKQDPPLVIKRFSGGGTVIVDENTLFITLIFSKNEIPISPFPEPIMRWSYQLYKNAWNINGFSLQGNDYTIFNKKCGGNAQYISKNRWLHHTSFLWDYSDLNMNYLLLPKTQPTYRQNRSHGDFLCRLKNYTPSQTSLIESLKNELVKRFDICSMDPNELNQIRLRDHRKAVQEVQIL